MNETEINWTDYTWNPMSGCTVIAPECKYCYAETLAENKRGTAGFPRGFDPMTRPHKLGEPRKLYNRLGRGALIFVNSMSDIFHDAFDDNYRDEVFDVMREYDMHRYQVLTKRIDNALRYFETREVPRSVWMGVTCGHSSRLWTVDRLKNMRELGARVLFVSAEPLLSDLANDINARYLVGIDWLISGGESGNHFSNIDDDPAIADRALVQRVKGSFVPRPDRVSWIRDLDALCARNGTAHWFKQWGGTRPKSGGRKLDGRELDGMPTELEGAMPDGGRARPRGAQISLPVLQ